ncbi:MAG: TonB-dependent receptor [Terriglobia bacterium]
MFKLRTSSTSKLFLLLGLTLALGLPTYAQVETGTFAGTVEDPSGAVVPGATVTITNQGTNRSATHQTDASGTYRIVSLQPGLYSLKVEARGFKTSVNRDVELTVGATQRVDFKMELGQETQTVTVEAVAPLVNTEEGRLSHLISGGEVANLPLNGRNVYQLMQLAPGAVNVADVMLEAGADTVVNGIRENFNGFLVDGVANKGLSGGYNIQPNQDIVQEFRINDLNMSAEFGNSAGSVTTIVTKAGTNQFHGSAYEFLRNDALDANDFFRNQAGCELGVDPLCNGPARGDGRGNLAKTPLRFNQFGVTAGGPIRKDKTFFFASFQGSRTKTFAAAVPVSMESPQWREAVINALPNSTAALIYKDFGGPAGSVLNTVDQYVVGNADSPGAWAVLDGNDVPIPNRFDNLVCPDNIGGAAKGARYAGSFQTLFGVTPDEAGACPGLVAGQTPTQSANRSLPFQVGSVALMPTQTIGNLYNANEWSARIDHNFSEGDRIYGRFYLASQTDQYGPNNVSSLRGFATSQEIKSPNMSLTWTHVFSPTVINELRGGFSRNRNDIGRNIVAPGVPYVVFDTGDVGFGSYNGYPQFFTENVYDYSDMLSITKGKHGLKMGVEFRRNIENSEFNVARPSYYFFDNLYFAADAPELISAGVDPGILTNHPAELATNNRAWRNLEFGAFIQDDWKVTPHLTINLGLRYDIFRRHTEKFNRVTQFIFGEGANVTEALRNANTPAGEPGCDTPEQIAQAQLAGVCGPGGFAAAKSLGAADLNNFSPRFGFAWDPRGGGKTSIRGGAGVSYEGTLYNPLSNSRWNLPYYSFNESDSFLIGDVGNVVYGPHTVDNNGNVVFDPTQTPTYEGPGTNPGQGVGAQAVGNLVGWDAHDPNLAYLTAIVPNKNFRDPYVYNWFFGVQHEVVPNLVLEVNYVGTAGHKLFRAQQINRVRGGRLGVDSNGDPVCVDAQGQTVCGTPWPLGRVNPNYGTMRIWENSVNSNYHGLQISVTKKMSRGFAVTSNYTWSHVIDGGSDWHSGATSINGPAAGDGYSFDVANPGLDRGHATFDFRHRFTLSQVWELPWMKGQQGFKGHILGGWQLNSIWILSSGAHWTPYASGASRDANLDGIYNDRWDQGGSSNNINANEDQYANGYFYNSNLGGDAISNGFATRPCLACDGNMARNTMLGPGRIQTDLSLFKNIRVTEKISAQLRGEFFNAFNRVNIKMPNSGTGGNNGTRLNSAIFGAGNGAFDPRQIQVALKLLW